MTWLPAAGAPGVLVDRAVRWDINVRESAVLGLVGAGGIGMALDAALNLFQWERVALILIAIVVIVIVAEVVVTQVRRRVI
jgi:phosphonate transport system permease protein